MSEENSAPDIEPMHDFVLVRIEKQTETAGGIIVPDAAQGVLRCKVLAVGPGKHLGDGTLVAPQCKPGDYVLPLGSARMELIDENHALVRAEALSSIDRRSALEPARIVTTERMIPKAMGPKKPYGLGGSYE